jgi:hypothetical protein
MLRSTLILGLGTENSLKLDLRNEVEMYILVETNVAQLFCDPIITGCSVDDDRQLPGEIISGYKWVYFCE